MIIISQAIKKIWHILLFFIIFFTILIATLKHGISIENIDFNDFKIEKLYIKLDKKLILRAQKLKIPKTSHKDSSNEDFLSLTNNIIWIDRLFKEIILENIEFEDNELTVLFYENAFHVDTAYLTLDTTFTSQENGLFIDVYNLAFKDFDINLSGTSNADIRHNIYDFNGTFVSHELDGKMKFHLENEIINYDVSDINASSLKSFMHELDVKLNLNEDVKNWIYGYIVADNYFVHNLSGKVDLKTQNFFLNELSAKGVSKNLKVKFEDSLPAAIVEEADIELKNETLYFKLKKPRWNGKNLNGSNLEIYKIFDEKNAGLILNLQTNSIYDKAVNSILKAYDINVPIEQKSGRNVGKISIDIKFDPLKVTPNGKFKAKDSKIDIAGAMFNVKEAIVEIRDDKIIVDAKDSGMDFFKGDIKVAIDATKEKGDVNGTINKFDLSFDGEEIVKLKNLPLNASLDFRKKDVLFDILDPRIQLSFGDESTIRIDDISKIYDYSPLIKQIGLNSGNFTLKTKNFDDFEISLRNAKFNMPFLNKDGSKYDSDGFDIKIGENLITANSLSNNLNINIKDKKTEVHIKNMDLVIDNKIILSDKSSAKNKNLEFDGLNSDLFISDLNRTLKFLSYNGSIVKDKIQFNARPQSGNVSIIQSDKKFNMFANDITGDFVNNLFGMDSFEGGFFKLRIVGNSTDDLKGEIRLHGANLKSYTFYNQLLTFLNSVPSLIIFKTPDFTEKGFPVKFGKILFEKKGDLLNIIAIELDGSSADIGGRGTINLATKEIDVDLELRLLKDASSIIGSIPIVNQIILGKDRRLSTVIKVRGTLDKPKYSTQVLADTLMSPLKIIRNVLEAPFLIFE